MGNELLYVCAFYRCPSLTPSTAKLRQIEQHSTRRRWNDLETTLLNSSDVLSATISVCWISRCIGLYVCLALSAYHSREETLWYWRNPVLYILTLSVYTGWCLYGRTGRHVLVTRTPDPPHWNSVLCPTVGWLKTLSLVLSEIFCVCKNTENKADCHFCGTSKS